MLAYLGFMAVLGLLHFSLHGFDRVSISIFLASAVVFALPFYFEARRAGPADVTESIFATAWIWFRRLVCLSFALLLLLAATTLAVRLVDEGATADQVVLVPIFVGFAALLVQVGWYGRRGKGSTFQQDIDEHARRQERYRR